MTGLCKKQLDDPRAGWEAPSEQDVANLRQLRRPAAKERGAMNGELMTSIHGDALNVAGVLAPWAMHAIDVACA